MCEADTLAVQVVISRICLYGRLHQGDPGAMCEVTASLWICSAPGLGPYKMPPRHLLRRFSPQVRCVLFGLLQAPFVRY